MTLPKATYYACGDSVDHTPNSDLAAGGVVVIGTTLVGIATRPIASATKGAIAVEGEFFGAVDAAAGFDAGDDVYWDADGTPEDDDYGAALSGCFTDDPTLGPWCGKALQAAASGRVLFHLNSRDGAVTLARSAFVQEDLKAYPIPLSKLRVWDAPQTNPVGTPANDDLGLIYNTFGTAPPSVETGDLKAAGATTRRVGFQLEVPVEYVAGQTATMRLNAGMKTTVADTTCVIDLEVYRAAAPTTDICATSQQSINSLTAANKDFTLTPTDLVPGDVLDCRVSIVCTDGATATAVIGKLYLALSSLLLDIKG